MKTTKFLLTLTALSALSLGLLGWHLAGGVKDAAAVPRNFQPSHPVTPLEHGFGDQTAFNAVAETPEMKNARIMADAKIKTAEFAVLAAAYKSGGVKGLRVVQMDQQEVEYMQFIKSLGFSDVLSAKVFQMLKAAESFYAEHMNEMSESLAIGGLDAALEDKIQRVEADLKGILGNANYEKIKYWENSQPDRTHAHAFEAELKIQKITLTEDQRNGIIDVLYQVRHGLPWFSLNSKSITISEKLAYIEEVKQKLAPVLSGSAVEVLGQYLRNTAEKAQENHRKISERLQKNVK